jgi:putative transposase
MSRKAYPSDLTDKEWAVLEPLIPPPKPGGRPRTVNMREVLNAILYVLRTGCQWGLLPHDFPPKGTVYDYFNTWRKSGVWERLNARLRQQVRQAAKREATPSAAILDSQSVKTTEKGASEVTTRVNR